MDASLTDSRGDPAVTDSNQFEGENYETTTFNGSAVVTDTVDTPWGLDWFVQAGHGGNGNRNCTLVEDASLATPAYPLRTTGTPPVVQGPGTSWTASTSCAGTLGDRITSAIASLR